ncbi:unnamed protein product [Onchocerca ochengi]|uniref:Ovule protein n=1 Tax=Onchocerca ochengi TaxID=42157 RepID=A0A182EFD8_ONCOC|nr:unnamed protein product [Onchocerca ochengi]
MIRGAKKEAPKGESQGKFKFITAQYSSALLLAWRLLISNGGNEKDEISMIGQNRKDDNSVIKNIDDSISDSTISAATAMESSSVESLKALLSTDNISDDQLAQVADTEHQQYSAESQFVPHCFSPQDIEHSLRYDSNIHNTNRYLLVIPELELCISTMPSSEFVKFEA